MILVLTVERYVHIFFKSAFKIGLWISSYHMSTYLSLADSNDVPSADLSAVLFLIFGFLSDEDA